MSKDPLQWRRDNPAKWKAIQARYRAKNRVKIQAQIRRWKGDNRARALALTVKWKSEHPDYMRNYHRRRMQNDPTFALGRRMRDRIRQALFVRRVRKAEAFTSLLGCSHEALKAYIEAQFSPGMTWENRALWHIDHIRPICTFDLADPAQRRVCFHYTNLRPLWALANLSRPKTWVMPKVVNTPVTGNTVEFP